MANKRTTLLIESKGGNKVESDLKKIGAIGEQTGKKIKRGSAEANKGLKAVDATVARTKVGMRQLGDRLGPLGAGLGKLGAGGLVAASGITAFALSIVKVVDAGNAAEKANFKIAALLKTTGSSSGQTAEDIDRIAKSIGQMTLATTNGVREAAAVLLTFKSVAGDAFERTLRVSQDLAAVMGTDIKAATVQLAKALEDPERNLSQLNRSGISFTTNQVDLIKSLVQTGNEAEALSAILGQIEGQLGGAGEAEAAGLAGRFDSLGEHIGIFAENVSKSTGLMSGFTKAVDLMAKGMQAINESVFPDIDDQLVDAFANLERANKRLDVDRLAGGSTSTGERKVRESKEELARLIAIRDAQVEASVAAKESAEVQRKARLDARQSAEDVKAATKAEAAATKAQLTADKKFATERKRALADIVSLQNKATKAGVEGVALLTIARDEELRKQFARLEAETITSAEFADARLAIEKTFQADKAEQEEKAAAKTTATLSKNAKKQVSVFVAPFSTAASNIQSSFADTFTDIYRGSVTTFEDLADSIKDIMARLAGEITALMVIRPVIAGISGSFTGSAGASAVGGAAGSAAGAGASGGIGAFLATGAGSNALAAAIAIGAGIAGNYVGGQLSGAAGINKNQGGNIGGAAGAIGGALFFGPGGAFLGAVAGNVLGNVVGRAFGLGSGSNKQKFGFQTGAGAGIDSPFGTLSITRQRGVDAAGILQALQGIDEAIASLLSPGQIAAVRGGLAGTGQNFSVKSFDNEPFDVVQTRLVRIIDTLAQNTVASGLLSAIPRGPGNIDALVQEAQKVIQLINSFNDEGSDLNNAQLALKQLNEQFDAVSKTAKQLGFSLTQVEERRQDAIRNLTGDFNTSVRDQILAIVDPLTLALEAQEAGAKERLENARTLGADLVEVERLNALERTKILESQIDVFASANSSISGFLQSLGTTGAGGLSVGQQSSNASTLFNQLLGSARTDPTARSDLANLLPTFVGLKQQELGSTPAFFEFTSFLDSTLRNLVDQGDTVSTLQDIGEAITAGDNAVIQTLESENAKLIDEIADLRTDINLLLNAPAAVG